MKVLELPWSEELPWLTRNVLHAEWYRDLSKRLWVLCISQHAHLCFLGLPTQQLTCTLPLLGLELFCFLDIKMFFRAKELNCVVFFPALWTDTVQAERAWIAPHLLLTSWPGENSACFCLGFGAGKVRPATGVKTNRSLFLICHLTPASSEHPVCNRDLN